MRASNREEAIKVALNQLINNNCNCNYKDRGLSLYIQKYIIIKISYNKYYTKSNRQLLKCLSSSNLNSFTEGESTVNWGSEFQSLITLLLKNFDLAYEFI